VDHRWDPIINVAAALGFPVADCRWPPRAPQRV